MPMELAYHEYHFQTAKSHLSQASLFGGNNVLIIKNDKKVPKKELDELVALTQKSPNTFLVYAYYGSDYKTSNKSFTPKDKADNIRFFEPNFGDATKLIQAEVARRGMSMDHYTVAHLYNSQNGNIALAMNELEKLSILNRPIERRDIDEQVYSLAEVKLDDLISQLLEKKEFRATLERLLESGEDPIRIITAISGFVGQLFMFVAQMKLFGNSDSRAVLGYKLPGFIEDQRAEQARRFKLQTYRKMLTHLLQSELTLKQSKSTEKEALLFAALLQLQRML